MSVVISEPLVAQPLRRLVAFALLCGACSGGGNTDAAPTSPNTPQSAVATVITVSAGSGQTARIGSAVAVPPSVVVHDQHGAVMAGVTVAFAITSGGGGLVGATATTDATGSASVGTWTMGKTVGTNTIVARVSGGANPSATITATARPPHWSVMVYMAADNSLAQFGYLNLQQMAAAGVNPEVQVVVQAEFNPAAFAQAGLTPASVDRTNYDTFRYVMDGSVSRPPNNALIGPTTDIGNVNMTDPATLRAFVQWAEQTAPSEHSVLVLWNHGGDQNGLIEDLTSAPGNLLTLPQLTGALTGLPQFDMIYFEMCLMGGYEPLAAVQGLTQTVVASEDEEYVAGWNFTTFLSTMYANTTVPTTTLATALANQFDAGYASLGLSETIAAYNMNGFGAVSNAVSQLAVAMNASSAATPAAVASAVAHVQRYTGFTYIADLGNVADSLSAHLSDSTVRAAAASVKQAVTSPGFLLTNHYRTGTQPYQNNEARSNGLTIVMPAAAPYALPSAGSGGLAAYQQEFSALGWTSFLARYVPAVATQSFVSVAPNQLTLWETWSASLVGKVWVELLLLEPDGSLSGPAFGSISPSGVFSADATVTNTYYEGWGSWPIVESGSYYFLAWLVSDPSNLKPLVNVYYQQGAGALTPLYGPGTATSAFPQLSFAASFQADVNSVAEGTVLANALAGLYTDLRPVATWTTGPAASSQRAQLAVEAGHGERVQTAPRITAAQIQALQRFAAQRRVSRGSVPPLEMRHPELLRVTPNLK